ncbi:MAG: HNH endonuclease [Henriciella sp.]
MAKRISARLARRLVRYVPETGEFFWRHRPVWMFNSSPRRSREHIAALWNSRFSGQPAFNTAEGRGYLTGRMLGVCIKAHTLAWLIETGEYPEQIDHINHVRTDNRFKNLRGASQAENAKNMKRYITNSSGVTGVHWHAASRKWRATIQSDGRKMHLGMFSSINAAAAARHQAEKRLGFHKNHGRAA